jgi:hypothetical protein
MQAPQEARQLHLRSSVTQLLCGWGRPDIGGESVEGRFSPLTESPLNHSPGVVF